MEQPETTSKSDDPKAQREPLLDFLAKLSLADIDLTREDGMNVGEERDPLLKTFPNKAV